MSKGGIVITTLGLFFIFIFFRVLYLDSDRDYLILSFLDVGQGDASLIQSPYGQNILIDGGEGDEVLKELAREMKPWDKTIDLMVLTHPHSDHVGGLVEVLKNYQVKKIIYSGSIHNSPEYIAWLKEIKNQAIKLLIVNSKQKIIFGDNCFLEIFASPLKNNQNNLNNQSLLSKLDCRGETVFYAGDAETDLEKSILEFDFNLESSILKIAHHGSDTSSSEEFLKAVGPSQAIISVGEGNLFGHPSNIVLRRLEKNGIKISRTDKLGTIRIKR